MKITNIECVPVQALGRTLVLVVVDTDAGISGVGEAGLQRRWQAIDGGVAHFRAWLIGQDPMRIEHLWQRLWRGGFYPADRLLGSAIAAIDIALWDIKGKALGAPIFELLGGRCRDHVECFHRPGYLADSDDGAVRMLLDHAFDGTLEPGQMAELALHCLDKGHRYFRLEPAGQDGLLEPRRAAACLAAQLHAVRDAVGDRMELMVDLHTRLDAVDAIWFCRQVESLNLFVVEDLVRSERPAAYRRIRPHVHVPIAAGEQWCSKWEFQVAIEEELIDFARVDVCIAGGLTEARKIAAMAETHYIKTLFHNPLGPVCTAASLHLDLACDNAGPQEVLFPPDDMLPDVFTCAFQLTGTTLSVPDSPGLGVEFDREAARKYPPEMTEPPHLHRLDGGFTNY